MCVNCSLNSSPFLFFWGTLSSFIATVVPEVELQGLICFPDVPLQCVKSTVLALLAYRSGLTKGSILSQMARRPATAVIWPHHDELIEATQSSMPISAAPSMA
jgi:hypothetical protein